MKRGIVLGMLVAVGVLSITVAGYQGRGQRPEGLLQQPQGPWKPGMEARIEKLRDNVYRILNTGSNCTAFITQNGGVVLVESGYAGWGHEILDKLKSVTNKPITIVISTHTHSDHTGSNVELGMARNVEFVAHENTRANLARERCADVGGCQKFQGENAKYLPKKTFKDKMSLLGGKDRIVLSYYGRAHTNGDIVVVFPGLRLAHVGDLFAWHGVPRVMTEDGGSVVDFPATLTKAQAAIKDVDTIITGHSRVMPWKEWVEVRDFLTYYVGEVNAANRAGKTVDEAIAGLKWPERFKVCPPQDTFVSQSEADYPKFHNECVFRTDQLKADTEIAYGELKKSAQARAGGLSVPDRPGSARPSRLMQPRILPLPEAQWTDVHRKLVAKYVPDGRAGNAVKTLLNVPELVDGTMPFQNYITRDSSLSPRHREILILRTGWLLNNDYVWGEHASIARRLGMTSDELRRIAQGPDARGWDPFEATLLRLADQLFRNSSVTDATWNALASSYDMYHMMDAVMTVADFTSTSLLYSSLGIQPDADFTSHIPVDIPYRVVVPAGEPPLRVARVEPLEGRGLGIGRTFQRYPRLAEPRSTGSNYVNQHSKLDPRYRELLILRTGWDCQAEYEWAQHVGSVGRAREKGLDPSKIAAGPSASGWEPFEVVLLNAADELYRDSFISVRTWSAMAARFDNTMLINATITAANYRMVSMALNTLGVQVDPGDERMPARR